MNKLFKAPAGFHETSTLQQCTAMSLHSLCLTELFSSRVGVTEGLEWSKRYKMTGHGFFHGLSTHLQRVLISVFLKPGDCSGVVSHWELLKSLAISEEILAC